MDRRRFLNSGAIAAAGGIALASRMAGAAAPDGVLDDLTIIRRALNLHPGLYRYQSPRQFERRFAAFADQWTARPATVDRFLALSRLTAQVRCGHTQCNPYNQTDRIVAEVFDRTTRLPFAFRWLENRMIVIGDSGARTGIARGSVIERLNGQRPDTLLAALLPYARADGGNDAKRISLMEMRGDEAFETFDIFQGLLAPPGPNGHAVIWRDPAGQRHQAMLPAVTYAARKALLPEATADAPIWDWSMREDGVAVLTMPSWVLYNSQWDWKAWLTLRLQSLTNAKGLIIDIRRNEGGNDVGTWLLERMIAAPFQPIRYRSRVRFREVPADLVPYFKTWDPSFRTLGIGARDEGDGLYTLSGGEDERPLSPQVPRITVPIAVLSSPINSSATFSFLRRVREARAATIYGEQSGGNLRGINGGAMFFVRLPQSGLEFDLPLKGYFPEAPQPDAAVRPDVAIAETPSDIASGRDPVMEAALTRFMA